MTLTYIDDRQLMSGARQLLRWFAFNTRRNEVLAAIALQHTRSKDTEGQALDFLVRHCGGYACSQS